MQLQKNPARFHAPTIVSKNKIESGQNKLKMNNLKDDPFTIKVNNLIQLNVTHMHSTNIISLHPRAWGQRRTIRVTHKAHCHKTILNTVKGLNG